MRFPFPWPALALAFLLPVAALSQAPAAVLLGGREVPREKFLVFLMIGHSNMAGRDLHRSDSVTHPRAWNYQWMSDKSWVLAKEMPGNLKNGLSGRGCGGGGMPLLKRLVEEFPDHHIGAVDNASLAATVRGSVDNNSSGMPGEDNRYWKGNLLFDEITAAAKEVRKVGVLGGIFCQLGAIEAVRSSREICESFSDDVARMVQDMRADIGEPNLPFLIGEYEAGATGIYSPSQPMPAVIAAQILLIPAKLPYSALVGSEGLEMLDDHHYTAGPKGQGEWARRAVEAYQAKGFFQTASIRPLGREAGTGGKSRARGPLFMAREGLTILPWDGRVFLIDGKVRDGAALAWPP